VRAARHEAYVGKVYGLAPGEYARLLELQGGRCAIPGCRANGTRKRLAVDHDHDLARQHDHPDDQACRDCVRGLLCSPHNYDLLGRFAGDLHAALAYLDAPPARRLRSVS
jgi:hypothetical protein